MTHKDCSSLTPRARELSHAYESGTNIEECLRLKSLTNRAIRRLRFPGKSDKQRHINRCSTTSKGKVVKQGSKT